MVDHVSQDKRSQIMAAVKGKDTTPEKIVRKLLHAAGYRYRLHVKRLPGKPDIVLRKYNAILFVQGCFWHGHGCHLSKTLPKTQQQYWKSKISSNQLRDEKTIKQLVRNGWRTCLVWECALKRKGKIDDEKLSGILSRWIKSKEQRLEVTGILPEIERKV